ncbi:hypothetical protein [Mycobacteroides sp. LB1]|uniref:hypothetical protein n=1 Tax=Mycobacteroides sp. LB1 TaxID=2750814 RepID=UPI0015E00665|nr:hypothetical protein [Mycobacteroides sp. LB1]
MGLAWLREQLQRTQLKRLWQVVTVAVLAVAAAFGGLGEAPTVKPVQLGETYLNGPLRITPHALVAGCKKVPFSYAYAIPDDKSILVLRVTIESVVDEDLVFDGNNRYKIFELQTDKSNDVFVGIVPEGGSSPVTDIAAGTTMEAGITWQVPNKWLTSSRTAIVNINDLEKKSQEFIPVVQWMLADRDTHGQLTAQLGRC